MQRRQRLFIGLIGAAIFTAGCTGARLPCDQASGTQQLAQGGAVPGANGAVGTATGAAGGAGSVAGAAGGATGAGGVAGSASYAGTATGGTAGGGAGTTTGGGGTSGTGRSTVAGPMLWSGPADTKGLTADSLTLCGHAALTYANAFDTKPSDLNVFWSAVNAKGGIYGRQVTMTYEDDAYDPGTAVEAAKKCEAKGIFMLLGGIGFDQIPNVRNWAESAHELYMHHTATIEGSSRLKYSFTGLPTVEQAGTLFGELATKRFAGKKIGILHRNSEYWDPGFNAFMSYAKAHHLNVAPPIGVEKNQANYTQELATLKGEGVEVVWAWENALAITEMVKQANQGLQWQPQWMVFPFNLTTQTIGADALGHMVGIAVWPAYSCHDYGGPFASYASTIKEFEAQYAKFDPNANICGVGGDLLFLNWIEQKALYEMFVKCGRACTRNKFAGLMLNHYVANNIPGHCPANFRDGHHGSDWVNVFEPIRGSNGAINWAPVMKCVEQIR